MTFRDLAAGLFFALTASIAGAQEVLSRQIPSSELEFTETRWTDGTVGQIIGWQPIAVNGQIEICGAAIIPTSIYRQELRRGLRQAKVLINDQVVLEDLSYWEQPRNVRRAEDATGNCKATGYPAAEAGPGSIRIQYRARARR
ncbi:hypothetical protein AADZ90_004975 [Aestuariibius sp. 2305UL40-4]|uniref:hypothetical protein n=1 Tax=Aestuariibius violaceus TaxID=3234132 RepID=UPI00345E6063